uniref:Uncharacterized protein n=1 Tax=Nelumbo nucifera TaxID=4432 RepID=A0A822Z680_NELNU|nr:TPA_asm: hypothetical protein HUJ06_013287 [Nelumbo nucifera]
MRGNGTSGTNHREATEQIQSSVPLQTKEQQESEISGVEPDFGVNMLLQSSDIIDGESGDVVLQRLVEREVAIRRTEEEKQGEEVSKTGDRNREKKSRTDSKGPRSQGISTEWEGEYQ